MSKLNKAEKTAVKKVKAQASTKVEVKAFGGYPLGNKVIATGKSPRVGHNQDWVSDFDGMTMAQIRDLKTSECTHDRSKGAFSYMIKYGYITIG